MSEFLTPIVEELANKFGFNLKQGLVFLGLIDIKCIFPFTGEIKGGCCAINWSYGLHTQCQKGVENKEKYCFKCKLKNDKNKLLGDIKDRLSCKLLDYTDNKGRKTIPWINYIKDKNLDLDLCLRAANNLGINIPREHLEKRIMRRGRPKKKADKEEFINNTFDIFGTDFSEEILELYGDEKIATDKDGNIYDLYDFGAVKRIH